MLGESLLSLYCGLLSLNWKQRAWRGQRSERPGYMSARDAVTFSSHANEKMEKESAKSSSALV